MALPIDPIVNDTELPKPHILIETSLDRWHAYWLINDLPLDQFTQVQKALIDRFNSDPSVHDLPRVMRLPGFIHHKVKGGIARHHSCHVSSTSLLVLHHIQPRCCCTALRGRHNNLFAGNTAPVVAHHIAATANRSTVMRAASTSSMCIRRPMKNRSRPR